MLRAYTAAAIRAAEQPLLDAGHGPALMQRAAYGLAEAVLSVLHERGVGVYGARVVLLIGSGNNGADALFAGVRLTARGVRTTALLTGARTHEDALAAFGRSGGRVLSAPEDAKAFLAEATRADVVVDGLLGTGGRGALKDSAAAIVARLRKIKQNAVDGLGTGPAVVACDLPSGIDASTGEVYGPVLAADVTVTFGAAKTGLLCPPAEQLCGQLVVVDIGLDEFLGEADVHRLLCGDVAELLPHPAANDQKYTRGVAGIVAGSAQYPGAALLAVAAASACGPGMVRYLGDPAVSAALHVRNPEAVCSDQTPSQVRVQAWLVGPGIDGDSAQLARAQDAMDSGLPTVVDAGALPLVRAADTGDSNHNGVLVLTPHAGELATLMTRLGVATTRADVEACPLAAARKAVQLTGATVVLKGPTTVVAAPNGTVFTQADGTASLATAGSGDTLAGILVALLAMGAGRMLPNGHQPGGPATENVAVAPALGAALHGRLARISPAEPLNAGMLAARIPRVWGELTATK